MQRIKLVFQTAWQEALKDFEAHEVLALCGDVPAPYVDIAEANAMRQLHDGRERTWLEKTSLVLIRTRHRFSLQYRVKRQIQYEDRRAGLEVAARLPYGR